MGVIQFAPSQNIVVETVPTNCLTDACLKPLRLGIGKTVYVTDLTFSSDDPHPITRVFFLVVAFTVALPFTLIGLLFQCCSSTDDAIYNLFKDAVDAGNGLSIKRNISDLIGTMKSKLPEYPTTEGDREERARIMGSVKENYAVLTQDFSSIQDPSLMRERLYLIYHLSTTFGDLKPNLTIFSQDQLKEATLNPDQGSHLYPGASTDDLLGEWTQNSLLKNNLRHTTYQLINGLPLLNGKGLLRRASEGVETAIQEDLQNFLKLCGMPLLCSGLGNIDTIIIKNKYDDLISDLIDLSESFKEEITVLVESLQKTYELTLDTDNIPNAPGLLYGSDPDTVVAYEEFHKAYGTLRLIGDHDTITSARETLEKQIEEQRKAYEAAMKLLEQTKKTKGEKQADLSLNPNSQTLPKEIADLEAEISTQTTALATLQKEIADLEKQLDPFNQMDLLLQGSETLATVIEKAAKQPSASASSSSSKKKD